MKNVLFAALIGAVAATTTWAQTPEARPVAPVPPPAPVPVFSVARPAPVPDPAPVPLFDVTAVAPVPAPPPVPLFNMVQAAPAAPAQPPAPAATARAVAPPAPAAPATPAAQAPVAPATVAAPRGSPAAPRNIRFDIVITETGGAKPTTKTISLTVNDSNGSGSVRNLVKTPATVSLNVDVRAVQAFEGGAVRASVNVEYQPYTPDASAPSSGIQSSITAMFQDGRRTQILQTSDPLSDRRVTVEVLATVLK